MKDASVPIRAVTAGPRFHWFGYYDKRHFDPTSRYLLGMEVGFEHRSPTADDIINIGLIDLEDGDRWTQIGTSRAWGWQQGCMLQWRPGSSTEVLWNDREGDRFVCRIHDIESGSQRVLLAPVYTVAPDGRHAVGADFRRINDMRPGYGYAGIPDPNADILAPDDVGVYTVDLDTGAVSDGPIVSIADAAAVPYPHDDISGAKHYFNHLLYNPDGTRFIFLHRWKVADGSRRTRMFTANADGSDLHVVDDYGRMSHFIWRDPETILGWSWQPSHEGAFYVFRDLSEDVEPVGLGKMTRDGHCTYLPATDWILNDGYPRAGSRAQELYLYHVPSDTRIELGQFPSPEPYTGEWRCDLHPRHNADGTLLTIDSAHAGNGRQIYLLDISEVIASAP